MQKWEDVRRRCSSTTESVEWRGPPPWGARGVGWVDTAPPEEYLPDNTDVADDFRIFQSAADEVPRFSKDLRQAVNADPEEEFGFCRLRRSHLTKPWRTCQ